MDKDYTDYETQRAILLEYMQVMIARKDYTDYETQRAILLEYMQVMIARGDWHGVSDAANDLRVLEAEEKSR
jgi:hypothetical protein